MQLTAIRKSRNEQGMSLVEATIILMTLLLLTAVLAPTIGDYTNDARDVKVKEDIEALGTAILRLLRDSGEGCLLMDASNNSCTKANRVDALYTDGVEPTVTATQYTIENSAITGTAINWLGASSNEPSQDDTAANQLIQNTPDDDAANQYGNPSYGAGGPRSGIGWRGAYITAPVGPDPWGSMYQANTVFLGVANNVTGTGEGQTSGGWRYDAIVISAGRNATIETAFASSTGTGGTTGVGDDVIYVMSGSTR